MSDVRRTLALALVVLLASVGLALAPAAPVVADDDTEPGTVSPYILGGVVAAPGAWPGTAAFVVDTASGLDQVCGGTLVRADLVVTAAHCTRPFDPADMKVLLGRSDLRLPGGELIDVVGVIEHPEWTDVVGPNDIAVVRLATATTRTPVPFVTPTTEPQWASRPGATLVGWGATDPDGKNPSPQLKELAVSVLSDDDCRRRVTTYLVGGDLCVESPTFGPCPGDSGGPLMVTGSGPPRMAGVISRGPEPCGDGPSIVTRMAAYADWVYQTTLSAHTTRTSGPDRYATAAALSARFAPGVPVAYLVTGEAFPDAVTAAAVAAAAGGPVLLTARNELPSATAAELARLRPGRLVVVGGTGAIADSVAAEAGAAAGAPAERVRGADRYGTAAAVALDSSPHGAGTVFLAVGTAFPDAVASGPVAGGPDGGPVLLTETHALPAAAADALSTLAPSRVVVLGGTAAVSPAVLDEVAALLPGATVERISGPDRFATSAALSRARFAPGVPVVHVATGAAFPDALASGPVAVVQDGPVLLLDGERVPDTVAEEIRRLRPGRIEVLGGTAAVPLHAMWLVDGLR